VLVKVINRPLETELRQVRDELVAVRGELAAEASARAVADSLALDELEGLQKTVRDRLQFEVRRLRASEAQQRAILEAKKAVPRYGNPGRPLYP
jgi:hypothetical protein